MKQLDTDRNEPIAVTGIGAMFPGRGTTSGFWRDIVEGVDTIRDIPESHWLIDDLYDPDPRAMDKTYSKRGAFIPAFPFEPMEFGLPPNTLEATDSVQLMALYVARQVLAEATRGVAGRIDRNRIGVVLGVGVGLQLLGEMTSRLNRPIWLKALREEGVPEPEAQGICDRIAGHYVPWQEATFPGLLGNVAAGRIANRLDLGGTNLATDAACASSLAALKFAVQELRLGEADLMLTGGSDALNTGLMYMCFSKTPALSASGRCQPFSAEADGTILGEGGGILALRRLSDAERDGDPIYAVIRGVGASSDGRANSVYAPRSEGQASAIRRAFAAAGYGPRTVELVEAHGTGTRAGDAAEFGGLRASFSEDDGRNWCALGSVKSQIGHTKAAAGAAGMVKAVLALHHKVLPPTIGVDTPNPKLDLPNSPFYLNTTRRAWVRGSGHPRRAGVSSFGFGGSNFHVALEEYVGPAPRPVRHRVLPAELFLVAGVDGVALVAALRAAARAIGSDDDMAHHAYRSQNAVDLGLPCRASIVAGSRAELEARVDMLEQAIARGIAVVGPDITFSLAPSRAQPLAVLCSGQGSQYLGMGADLAADFDLCRAVWDEAADLPEFAACGLHDIAFPPRAFEQAAADGHERALVATENAQPAIGAVTLAQLRLLSRLSLRIDAAAGHSFGELMALAAAGALDGRTALQLARARGAAMREASVGAVGAMIAVRASAEVVAPMLAAAKGEVIIANDNSSDQVILSGAESSVARVEALLRGAGLDCSRLPVSTAFHSPLVASASQAFGRALAGAKIAEPALPVYGNTDAVRYTTSPELIRARLATQLARPVLFRQMIEQMYADGIRTFVEVGPGAVLTGLVGNILRARPHLAVSLDHKRTQGTVQLLRAVGALICAGHSLDLTALWEHVPPPALRPAPSRHAVAVSGANLGRRYPPKGGSAALPPPNPPRHGGQRTDDRRSRGSRGYGVRHGAARACPSGRPRFRSQRVVDGPGAPIAPARAGDTSGRIRRFQFRQSTIHRHRGTRYAKSSYPYNQVHARRDFPRAQAVPRELRQLAYGVPSNFGSRNERGDADLRPLAVARNADQQGREPDRRVDHES